MADLTVLPQTQPFVIICDAETPEQSSSLTISDK